MKHCNRCNTTKNTTDFYKRAASIDGLMALCKECSKAAKRQWAKENRERLQEYDREYRKSPEFKKYAKEYFSNHQKENRAYWNSRNAKRRAAKLQRTPPWLTEDQLWLINEIYDLAALRTEATGVEHHVDHVVPLQGNTVSGLHLPWNLQVLTAYENLSKSNLI